MSDLRTIIAETTDPETNTTLRELIGFSYDPEASGTEAEAEAFADRMIAAIAERIGATDLALSPFRDLADSDWDWLLDKNLGRESAWWRVMTRVRAGLKGASDGASREAVEPGEADGRETEDQKWDRRSEEAMSLLYEEASARADAAEAERDAARAALRQVEMIRDGFYGENYRHCPVCFGSERHTPDCALAACLAEPATEKAPS